jgi:hypothetical protein
VTLTASAAPPDAGRRWVLRNDENTVTAVTTDGTVAEARVSEPDERVVVELWASPSDLPPELVTDLVARAFALPAMRPHRAVLVCVPRRDAALLEQAHQHVRAAWTRAAGTTCLIEGRIGTTPAAGHARSRP